MDRASVLVVAPYEGLKDLFRSTAAQFPDLEIDVCSGDFCDGANMNDLLQNGRYSVIISRGGTADRIRQFTAIPVVSIEISDYDIICSIRLAQNTGGRFAIVAFPGITDCARNICDILQYNVEIYTVQTADDVRRSLNELAQKNIGMVIGDVTTTKIAAEQGLRTILITSSRDSVHKSLREALDLHSHMARATETMAFLKLTLDKSDDSVFVFDANRNLIYNNSTSLMEEDAMTITELQSLVLDVLQKGNLKSIRRGKGKSLRIAGKRIASGSTPYVAFYISHYNNPKLSEFHGLTVHNPDRKSGEGFAFFYSESERMRPVMDKVLKASSLRQPVLLSGEKGTGKDIIAEMLHLNSSHHRNPMLIIDCKLLTLNNWNSFVDNADSPINETNYTVFFKNINHLPLPVQIAVFKYMESSALTKRHFVIASTGTNLIDAVTNNVFDYHLYAHLNSVTLQLPNLTERKEDIPAIVTMMLSHLNAEFGKNIIGFEDPAALEMLKNFKWQHNIDQLKMVVRQLAIMTDTAGISLQNTQEALRNSERQYEAERPAIDFNKTLEEIEKDVIRIVLEEEGMNQTSAARRLCISRATLWRKLK